MRLIAIHDAEGMISTLVTSPPGAPSAEIKVTEGQRKTELDTSGMKIDFGHAKIHDHLNDIIKNYRVEHEPQRESLGRLTRRTAK